MKYLALVIFFVAGMCSAFDYGFFSLAQPGNPFVVAIINITPSVFAFVAGGMYFYNHP